MGELRAAALANVQGVDPQLTPAQVIGMTPNPQALRLSVGGRHADGAAVHAHAAFFAKGLRVYQATVIGAEPAPQLAQTFFGGLRFPP